MNLNAVTLNFNVKL